MSGNEPHSEAHRLRAEALDAQVKLLVRAERDLYRSKIELDRQMGRIQMLNRFALEALGSADPVWILERAARLLFEVFPLEQALACLADGVRLAATAAPAVPGREGGRAEAMQAPPSCPLPPSCCTAPVFGPAGELKETYPDLARPLAWLGEVFGGTGGDDALVLALPLFQKDRSPLGLLLARHPHPEEITPHQRPPEAADAGFLELIGAHLSTAVESACLYADLERRVAERTAELQANLQALREAQDQLLQAGKMAAVGTLVAGLSHELSKPLMVIHGYAQALLDDMPEASESRRPLEAIERQSRRCQELVDALLDFSRKGPPVRERLEVGDLVDRVTRIARSHPACRSVDLEVSVDADARGELFANRSEVETAILNVVNNALEATAPNTAVRLRVRRRMRDGIEGYEFAVEDRGPGIPEEVRGRIFDPFFTTKPVGQGVGLGLSLTSRMVEGHGGHIEVESETGRGTVVTIWIPRGEGPTPAVIEE